MTAEGSGAVTHIYFREKQVRGCAAFLVFCITSKYFNLNAIFTTYSAFKIDNISFCYD